ncbi:hypothetical protein [Clostridium perfringens]|uniref:hypothetical protein n=1 Tax=Clostridium perfringens TaxID=1502 RepID=UPI0013E295C5|nr:hypothetical protein [Clostridium perfringens]WEV15992.1 hypothetical protein PL325_15520 [Clostridium perfringens D]MBI6091670.1 hypothetical protein [Clostridium perfringens]MBI6107800.1 hypothetical protein [Clostridium perfringens]MDH5069593.1 hypothetical protein [Clostridium perfringens]MDH5089275.1 hypothetical protein [Clostridium perfringens]
MKKYTLRNLVEEVTGEKESKENNYWYSKYELIRRTHSKLKLILGNQKLTYENKDKYVRLYKILYEDAEKRLLMNRYINIISTYKIEGTTLVIPQNKKELTLEEHIIVSETLLEFFKDEEKGEIMRDSLIRLKSVEYNEILKDFEFEIKRITTSIHGYPYEEKVKKMEEIKNYLIKQRKEIDKNVMENLIFPE